MFKTRDEAVADALGHIMAEEDDPEGSTLTICSCERQDLHSMSDEARSALMDACTRCERIFIRPGGHA